jgi:hypothetical protein
VKVSCLYLKYFKNRVLFYSSLSEFKCRAEKGTAEETRQRHLSHHAEGLAWEDAKLFQLS